eukprot:GHVP01036194.1.p1 GENE.GHVP01036194.1~~GHVP01036194.1.p1  ORF type:complete len:208 (+),score=29.85 GHVP01036194.1:190-813(+)
MPISINNQMAHDDMLVFPGDVVGEGEMCTVGNGAYLDGKDIVSGIYGKRRQYRDKENNTIVICVDSINEDRSTRMPIISEIVTCTIRKIVKEKAYADILSIGDEMCKYPINSTIPLNNIFEQMDQDIRITDCFRPGDLIKAKVLGKSSALIQEGYLLTTNQKDLGVINATSLQAGNKLDFLSEDRMIDPITMIEEKRKCAVIDRVNK